jgi:hypothetical protein
MVEMVVPTASLATGPWHKGLYNWASEIGS